MEVMEEDKKNDTEDRTEEASETPRSLEMTSEEEKDVAFEIESPEE